MAGWTGYRRSIRIAPEAGVVDVEMVDDCHHFGVTVHHDGVRVTQVETREPRHPWTTCPAAGHHLRTRMDGVTLSAAGATEDQRQHCTHLYDLFILAARHAHDREPMRYDIRVADPDVAGTRLAEIDRDGRTVLRWRIGGPDLAGGDARALSDWSRSLPDAMQEAARMLRRGVMVSAGRFMDWPAGTAATVVPIQGACYTFQAERSAIARRNADTVRDFSADPDPFLAPA